MTLFSESESDYETQIRRAVRGFWSGLITYDQFFSGMLTTIRGGLTEAWTSGIKSCGLLPGDMTSDERTLLERRIIEEGSHIGGFADFITENSKANSGLLRDCFGRAELWTNRYKDLVNHAKVISCGDKKLQWVWTPGKRHCSTCGRLHGRVYRASVWHKNGVRPQSPPNSQLECGGWKCGCSFQETDEKVTPGPFPGTP